MTEQKNVGMAVIAYFGILIIVPFLTDAKNDPYVKFHMKQALVLLIVGFVTGFIWWIPLFGWALAIAVFILWLMGVINAASGKMTPVPLVGKFAEKFKF